MTTSNSTPDLGALQRTVELRLKNLKAKQSLRDTKKARLDAANRDFDKAVGEVKKAAGELGVAKQALQEGMLTFNREVVG